MKKLKPRLTLFAILTLALLLIGMLTSTIALDIIAPLNETMLNGDAISFEYYNGIHNTTQCTLHLDELPIVEPDPAPGINSFTIGSLDEGKHDWQIICENETTSDASLPRTLIVDRTAPEMVLGPTPVAPTLEIELNVTDDWSETMSCMFLLDTEMLDTVNITNGTTFTKEYTPSAGNSTLTILCDDQAGNQQSVSREVTIPEQDYLRLATSRQIYGLGEQIALTVDAPSDANVSIDICPIADGFVQCLRPIVDDTFPQVVLLPYNNQSGDYLVEGIAVTPRGTLLNTTNYTIQNTMTMTTELSRDPKLLRDFNIAVNVFGGIGDLSYTFAYSNGTTVVTQDNTLTVMYDEPGTFSINITVTDEAGNEKSEKRTFTIEEIYPVQVTVYDNRTRAPITGAAVGIAGQEQNYATDTQGRATLDLPDGTSKIYVSKEGYQYVYQSIFVDDTHTSFSFWMNPSSIPMTVELKQPTDGATLPVNNLEATFAVLNAPSAACALFVGATDELLEQYATMTVNDSAVHAFPLDTIAPGTYSIMIECDDGTAFAATEIRHITATEAIADVENETETAVADGDSYDYDFAKDYFQEILTYLEGLDKDSQELLDLLGIRTEVRQAKRTAAQYSRDLFDLQYRNDLTAAERNTSKKSIEDQLDALYAQTAVSLEVLDSESAVSYITEEEIQSFLKEAREPIQKEFDVNPEDLLDPLVAAQQRYTMTTTVYHAMLTFADGREQMISVVVKQLEYGSEKAKEGTDGESLIEIIPKSVAESAEELVIKNLKYDILIDDPVLRMPADDSIVYYVEGEVELSELLKTRTMLVPATLGGMERVTGYSIFGLSFLDGIAGKLGISLTMLIMILVAGYLIYYFNVIDQVKFLLYEAGPRAKTHYMKVLINDVKDMLRANEYEKAVLIYKEIKLSYDQLPLPAKNEVFENISELCTLIDKSYLQQQVVLMDEALKQGDLPSAISYYEHIEGTFERLPIEEQDRVVTMVRNLGKRLGLTAGVAAGVTAESQEVAA